MPERDPKLDRTGGLKCTVDQVTRMLAWIQEPGNYPPDQLQLLLDASKRFLQNESLQPGDKEQILAGLQAEFISNPR